ncbi:hypothetical protein CH330_02745, partial [candidate division WOR-3 bacterium JGI_Cruoil_03_51_56]
MTKIDAINQKLKRNGLLWIEPVPMLLDGIVDTTPTKTLLLKGKTGHMSPRRLKYQPVPARC